MQWDEAARRNLLLHQALFGTFGMPNHAASDTYIRATEQVVQAPCPVLLPASRTACDMVTLLARLDGIILTGSRSNVQPSLYDGPPHAEGTPEDPARDEHDVAVDPRAAIQAGVSLCWRSAAGCRN